MFVGVNHNDAMMASLEAGMRGQYLPEPQDDGDSYASEGDVDAEGSEEEEEQTGRLVQRWTVEEQQLLEKLVQEYGTDRKWAKIAQHIPGRTGKQCRERYLNHMRPDIKKGQWTTEEEAALAKYHSEIGSLWSRIAAFLPGRTENSVKNHWNALFRSKNLMRKQTSLLAIYVALVKNGMDGPKALAQAQRRMSELERQAAEGDKQGSPTASKPKKSPPQQQSKLGQSTPKPNPQGKLPHGFRPVEASDSDSTSSRGQSMGDFVSTGAVPPGRMGMMPNGHPPVQHLSFEESMAHMRQFMAMNGMEHLDPQRFDLTPLLGVLPPDMQAVMPGGPGMGPGDMLMPHNIKYEPDHLHMDGMGHPGPMGMPAPIPMMPNMAPRMSPRGPPLQSGSLNIRSSMGQPPHQQQHLHQQGPSGVSKSQQSLFDRLRAATNRRPGMQQSPQLSGQGKNSFHNHDLLASMTNELAAMGQAGAAALAMQAEYGPMNGLPPRGMNRNTYDTSHDPHYGGGMHGQGAPGGNYNAGMMPVMTEYDCMVDMMDEQALASMMEMDMAIPGPGPRHHHRLSQSNTQQQPPMLALPGPAAPSPRENHMAPRLHTSCSEPGMGLMNSSMHSPRLRQGEASDNSADALMGINRRRLKRSSSQNWGEMYTEASQHSMPKRNGSFRQSAPGTCLMPGEEPMQEALSTDTQHQFYRHSSDGTMLSINSLNHPNGPAGSHPQGQGQGQGQGQHQGIPGRHGVSTLRLHRFNAQHNPGNPMYDHSTWRPGALETIVSGGSLSTIFSGNADPLALVNFPSGKLPSSDFRDEPPPPQSLKSFSRLQSMGLQLMSADSGSLNMLLDGIVTNSSRPGSITKDELKRMWEIDFADMT